MTTDSVRVRTDYRYMGGIGLRGAMLTLLNRSLQTAPYVTLRIALPASPVQRRRRIAEESEPRAVTYGRVVDDAEVRAAHGRWGLGGVYRWGGCGCRGEGVRNEVESGVGVGVRREVGRVRGEGAVEESGCKEMLQGGEGCPTMWGCRCVCVCACVRGG